jgi:hypothetical protein
MLPGMTMVQKPAGASVIANLLTKTEKFDDSVWIKSSGEFAIAVTADATTDPLGGNTADLLTCAATFHFIRQQVAVEPATQYTFSWYARQGTLDPKYSVFDNSNGANIVAPTSYTATGSWQRFSATFTTPSGCTQVSVYPARDSGNGSPATLYVWGAMLNLGATALTYESVD